MVLARTTHEAAGKHYDPSFPLGMTGQPELEMGNHKHAQKRLALPLASDSIDQICGLRYKMR
ncbi:MAG: hypothetical protein WB683_08250 [Candidatus Sulfotelmatobacter sp.]